MKSNTGSSQSVGLANGFATTGNAAVTVTTSWQQFYINSQTDQFGELTTTIGTAINFGHYPNNATQAIDILIYSATESFVTYETSPRASDQVITTSAAYYGPRFDYYPSGPTAAGLLLENTATNIVLWSNDLTNAAWTKGATATVAMDQTGVDGVANGASSIKGGAVSATNTVLQSITLASSTRAQSAYVKGITVTGAINMTTDGGSTWVALSSSNCFYSGTGTAPATGQAVWLRCSFSQASVTNPSVGFQVVNLNDKIAVQYVDNETGAFSTSAIHTGAASVARTADTLAWTGQTASKAFVVETADLQAATVGTQLGINTAIGLGETAANALTSAAFGASATSGNTATWTGNVRGGITFDGVSALVIDLNGGTVASTTYTPASITNVYLGATNNGASGFINGHLRYSCSYSTFLSNANLIAKSTVGAGC